MRGRLAILGDSADTMGSQYITSANTLSRALADVVIAWDALRAVAVIAKPPPSREKRGVMYVRRREN